MSKDKNDLSRRQVVQNLGVALSGLALGCGAQEGDASSQGGAHVGTAAIAQAASDDLLKHLDHIVVLCMENRSFDHYLGSLRLDENKSIDGLTGAEFNLAPDGSRVQVARLADFTPADPPHSWDAAHAQWNRGLNDGFVRAHAGAAQAEAMGYYVREQLPIHYALSDSYATCDRWFCSVLGPTWPNRMYLHGATSNGKTANNPAFRFRSIWGALSEAGISNRNYYHDVAWATGGFFKLSGLGTIERFYDDAARGELPAFSLIDPHFFGAGANDDHPAHDVRLGQALIGTIYAALAKSPQWSRTLFVVTYDEHGGFYDHVPPPTRTDEREAFTQLGFRVPALVAGPTVWAGATVSTVFDHASVLSTVTRRFGLRPLNARLNATPTLASCIDPAAILNPRKPVTLPPVKFPLRELTAPRALLAFEHEHPELRSALQLGRLPPELDRRAQGLQIAERGLRYGAELGAVELH